MKHHFRIFDHNYTYLSATITEGRWSKKSEAVATIDVSMRVPNARAILEAAARGACEALDQGIDPWSAHST